MKTLARGETILRESNTAVIMGKWRDKQDVMVLTTKEIPQLTDTINKMGLIAKTSSTILQYNAGKSFIDVSDQLPSYGTSVR